MAAHVASGVIVSLSIFINSGSHIAQDISNWVETIFVNTQ